MDSSPSTSKAVAVRRSDPKAGRLTRRRTNSSSYVKHNEISGHKISPGVNPPDLTYQPWNNVILLLPRSGKDNVAVTVRDLADRLKEQIDPTKHGFRQDKDYRVQMRVQTIRVWNLTGKMVALSVEDFLDSTKDKKGVDQLCGLVDAGSATHTPAIGYVLPLAHRNCVLRNDDDESDHTIFLVSSGSGDQVYCYVTLLWRFDGPVKTVAFHNQMITMIKGFRADNNDKMTTTIQELQNVVKAITDNSPSLIKKGVEIAACVAPLVAEEGTDGLVSQLKRLTQALENVYLHPDNISTASSEYVNVKPSDEET